MNLKLPRLLQDNFYSFLSLFHNLSISHLKWEKSMEKMPSTVFSMGKPERYAYCDK